MIKFNDEPSKENLSNQSESESESESEGEVSSLSSIEWAYYTGEGSAGSLLSLNHTPNRAMIDFDGNDAIGEEELNDKFATAVQDFSNYYLNEERTLKIRYFPYQSKPFCISGTFKNACTRFQVSLQNHKEVLEKFSGLNTLTIPEEEASDARQMLSAIIPLITPAKDANNVSKILDNIIASGVANSKVPSARNLVGMQR